MHRQNPPRQRRRQRKSMLAHGICISKSEKDQINSTRHSLKTSPTTARPSQHQKQKQKKKH
jgi:hypothetical protein